jgi:aspartyl-tRNA(Asn)/glutamyl-tRNA(Gln) amidotransferase subunit A
LWTQEYLVKELSEDTRKLWEEGAEAMAQQGAEVVEVSLPHTQYALPAYYILAPAEASSNLSRYDGLRYGKTPITPQALVGDQCCC